MMTDSRQHFIPPSEWRLVAAIAVVAMIVRVVFWGYVDRVWEDGLITVLHAENFWRGLGLTHFHNGQGPVHGFTSPLSVLVPWLGEAFGEGRGLQFFRLVSTVASAATVVYTYALCRHRVLDLPVALAGAAAGYMALEYQQILWGMSGLEAQLVVLILLMSCYHLCNRSERDVRFLGVLLGACMLARPDMLFWCAIAGLCVLHRSRREFATVVVIGCAVYVPWLVFAHVYYGSFIPNTIHAKEAAFGGYPLPHSLADILRLDKLKSIFTPLGPSFGGYGTGFQLFADRGWLSVAVAVLAFIGAGTLLGRRQSAGVAIALFFLAYTAYYLYLVPIVFGWYLVPLCGVSVVLAGVGFQAIGRRWHVRTTGRVGRLIPALYVVLLAALLPMEFRTERQIQRYVEDDVRKAMGLYLREAMQPEQTVSLEPLGYVSYYSRRDVYDTPGLANPKVVAFYKTLPRQERNLYRLVEHFQPDFVVLRPGDVSMEYGYFLAHDWFRTLYGSDRAFVADPEKLRHMWRSGASYDVKFVVFKRRAVVGSVSVEQWQGTAVRPAADGDGIPAQPRRAGYVVRAPAESGLLASKPMPLPRSTKIAMFVRSAAGTAIEAELVDPSGTKIATRSVQITGGWAFVGLDASSSQGPATPLTLRLRAAAGQTLELSQPFLLSADEMVDEFKAPREVIQSWASDEFQTQGPAWSLGAVYDKSLAPPEDGLQYVFGSRGQGDAGTGSIASSTVNVTDAGMRLRLYAITGPDATGQRLGLDTDGDGAIDVLIAHGNPNGWHKVDLDLAPYVGKQIRVVATDEGGGWGQWSGFSQPLVYRR